MTPVSTWPVDPALDLVLQREIDVPRELVYKVWTDPEHLKHWFCPRPWSVSHVELDPRPGGIFHTIMRSPEGRDMPSEPGCVLEAIPNEKLVFTDAMYPNYRPKENGFFTAVLLLETIPTGTRYTAIAIHKTPEGKQQHEDMGFFDGWGTVVTQMVEYIKAMA